MDNHFKTLALSILLSIVMHENLLGQKKIDLKPSEVIDAFVRRIGGVKWQNLKSRKEYAYVEYESDKNVIIPADSYDRIKIDLHTGASAEVHKVEETLRSIFVYQPQCNWYYSNKTQMVKFFGPEPIKFKNLFPRTELMEPLNLETAKEIAVEDTLYRVDCIDKRQYDGKQSLFFGINSGLLYKRSYVGKNEVHWEFEFSDYRESQGFVEPHKIVLMSNGKTYFTINVQSIQYNVEIAADVFDPPVPCRNYDDYLRLEFTYLPDIK